MPDKTQGGRESFRLLYPPHKPARGTPVPDSSFFHTLQIDQMVSVRRESWRGLPDLRLEQFYTTDTEVLAWRLDVVADLVESEALRGLIRDALPLLRDAAEMRKVLNSSSSTVESSLASVRYLELYLELVELFHARLADAPIRSAGFAALRDEVEARRQSADYRALTAQLEKTQYQIGHVKSIALGVNLDGTLRVTEVGLLALNTEKYRQGSVLDKLLGRDKSDPMVCISGFANLAKTAREEEKHALDQAVCRALDNAFAKTIRSWEPVIDQYFRDETSFFIGLLDDFRFLSAASAFLWSCGAGAAPSAAPPSAPWRTRPSACRTSTTPCWCCAARARRWWPTTSPTTTGAAFTWSPGPTTGANPSSATRWGWPRPCSSWGCWCPPGPR